MSTIHTSPRCFPPPPPANLQQCIPRVWAEESLRDREGRCGALSKVNVADLSNFLEENGAKHIALMSGAELLKCGSNRYLDGFLRVKTKGLANVTPEAELAQIPNVKDPHKTSHGLLTTSLLSRALDFTPDIKHVCIVAES
ncbi:hypothetical protein HWV62_12324 [Athelia sp. TMB]|nr:hypothetical protein HWV62_12324 [Athelia sp. TMB]